MQGVIDKCDMSKTGKSYRVKVGNAWYGAKKDTGVNSLVGKSVTFDVESSEQFGTWMVNVEKANGHSLPSNTPAATAGMSAPWFMPFVSNTVAHAIAAGKITGPGEIKMWAAAAKQAAEEL